MRINKSHVATFLAIACIYWGLYTWNPGCAYRIDLNKFEFKSTQKTESAHIIAYGVPASEIEPYYLALRSFFEAYYVNKKVKVYKAIPDHNGIIGSMGGMSFLGIYRKSKFFGTDVIVYNGEELVLIHELTHFFYYRMKTDDAVEMPPRLTTALLVTLRNQAKTLELLHVLQNKSIEN